MGKLESYPDLLTRNQAAEVLGISTRTLDRMIARGDIVTYRLPGSKRVRIQKAELLATLQRVQKGGHED